MNLFPEGTSRETVDFASCITPISVQRMYEVNGNSGLTWVADGGTVTMYGRKIIEE